MRHWYRYETADDRRKDALCTFLRRSHYRYESGGLELRKLFGRPGGAGHIGPRNPTFFVTFFVNDDELEDIRNWLRTH